MNILKIILQLLSFFWKAGGFLIEMATHFPLISGAIILVVCVAIVFIIVGR